MKTMIWGMCIALMGPAFLSCQEEGKDAYVEGSMTCSECTGTTNFNGSLAKGGADYYGSCERNEDGFVFEVGHADRSHLEGPQAVWMFATASQAPLREGVFQPGTEFTINNAAEYSPFDRVILNNVNEFTINGGTAGCNVIRFAKPIAGEVMPLTKKGFDFYVEISCSGMSVPAANSSEVTLSSFTIKLFFKDC